MSEASLEMDAENDTDNKKEQGPETDREPSRNHTADSETSFSKVVPKCILMEAENQNIVDAETENTEENNLSELVIVGEGNKQHESHKSEFEDDTITGKLLEHEVNDGLIKHEVNDGLMSNMVDMYPVDVQKTIDEHKTRQLNASEADQVFYCVNIFCTQLFQSVS